MSRSSAPKLLFADPQGKVMEHPYLIATLRSGEELLPPTDRPIPLPSTGKLVHLPGRLPVGVDPETGEFELVREMKVGGKTFVPNAVGALLPPGYTRTFLPGEVKGETGPILPQWAYTAAAWGKDGPVAWAIHTDKRSHWDPERLLDPRAEEARRPAPEAVRGQPGPEAAEDLRARLPLLHLAEHLLRPRRGRDPRVGDVQRALRRLHLRPARGRAARLARPDGGRPRRRGDGPDRALPPRARAGPDDGLASVRAARASRSPAGSRSPRRSRTCGRATRPRVDQHQHQRLAHQGARGAVRRRARRDPRLAQLGDEGPLRGVLQAAEVRLGGRRGARSRSPASGARTSRSTCCSSPASPIAAARSTR